MRSSGSLTAPLHQMTATFLKVTTSYWPGLFHCYDVADLPRTNNDLEQLFGSHRYHERRSSGRKVASPGLVVRGSVRVPAGLATRLRGEVRGEDLAPSDLGAWRELRAGLGRRQEVRAQGRRFRRDPAAYLRELEDDLIKKTLPSKKKSPPSPRRSSRWRRCSSSATRL